MDNNLTEMELIEVIGNYFSGNHSIIITTENKKTNKPLKLENWKEFEVSYLY